MIVELLQISLSYEYFLKFQSGVNTDTTESQTGRTQLADQNSPYVRYRNESQSQSLILQSTNPDPSLSVDPNLPFDRQLKTKRSSSP